jgi:hypothetical protein
VGRTYRVAPAVPVPISAWLVRAALMRTLARLDN